ncbi:unnamed protein product [Phytomonas sp. EM1]|nr:unnamed protein product [Phytomonas sp. EM1]|eukprot:CCW62685.1 unnamed protein product [Phytomonas sp. isolate EM1]
MISPDDSGNESNAFPMLPSFLRDLMSIRRDNALIRDFERVFSLDNRCPNGAVQCYRAKQKVDTTRDATLDASDGLKEDALLSVSNGNKKEQRDAQSQKNVPNSVALPDVDYVIQSSKRCAEVEMMCEDIAKEIVESSAELYASCLFDAMKYIYTSFSAWDELREMVAHSFLTRDCSATGPPRPDGEGAPPSCPTSALTLSAVEQLRLAARPERKREDNAQWLHAGNPPRLIPMDEYCRYVVERLSQPSCFSFSYDKSERNTSKRTISYEAMQTGLSSMLSHHFASGDCINSSKVPVLSSESDGGRTSQESVPSLSREVPESSYLHVRKSPMRARRSLSSSPRLRSDKSNSQAALAVTKWSGDGTIRIYPSLHDKPAPPSSQPGKRTTGAVARRAYASRPSKTSSTHTNRIKDTTRGAY